MGFPYNHPLFLPKGTIRALLTLSLSLTLIYHDANSNAIAQSFSTLVAVALSFYFGGRMRGGNPGGETKSSERAFALPSGSVRLILILIFGAYAFYQISTEGELANYILDILYTIGGYLAGALFRKIFSHQKSEKPTITDHLKSLIAIIVTGSAIVVSVVDPTSQLTASFFPAAAIFLGFYFGSRD